MVRLLGAGLLLVLVPVVAQAEEPLRSAPSATAGVEKACGAGTEADEREFAAALDAFAQRRAFTQKLMAAREAEAFEQAIAHQARADKLFKAGKSKQQVVEAKPTRDFDAKWNRNTPRTPDQYVESMYYDLARHQLK